MKSDSKVRLQGLHKHSMNAIGPITVYENETTGPLYSDRTKNRKIAIDE